MSNAINIEVVAEGIEQPINEMSTSFFTPNIQ